MEIWNKLSSKLSRESVPNSCYAEEAGHYFSKQSGLKYSTVDEKSYSLYISDSDINIRDVRVLVYRDCSTRGRKLLYDSKTVVRVNVPPDFCACDLKSKTSSCRFPQKTDIFIKGTGNEKYFLHPEKFVEVSGGYGYQYREQAEDTKVIEEYIFGSVPLTCSGISSKLHIIHQDLCKILFSVTFPKPKSCRSFPLSDMGPYSFGSSFSSGVQSMSPLHVCSPYDFGHLSDKFLGSSNSGFDSGFDGTRSSFSVGSLPYIGNYSLPNTPVVPPSRSGSKCSLRNSGSFHKSLLRNVSTLLENLVKDYCLGEEESLCLRHHMSTILGLAVIFELDKAFSFAEDWLLSHTEIIDNSLKKLIIAVETAYANHLVFVSTVYEAVEKFCEELSFLIYPSKLHNVRLHEDSVEHIGSSFTFILKNFDSKDTNFFVSRMLTAVLTHHLGWVLTVDDCGICDKEQALVRKHTSEQHAPWFAYDEIYASSDISQSARTILSGSDIKLLKHLLKLLSYVMRYPKIVKRSVTPVPSLDCLHIEDNLNIYKESFPREISSPKFELTKCSSSFNLSCSYSSQCDALQCQVPLERSHSPSKLSPSLREARPNPIKWMLNDDIEIIIDPPDKEAHEVELVQQTDTEKSNVLHSHTSDLAPSSKIIKNNSIVSASSSKIPQLAYFHDFSPSSPIENPQYHINRSNSTDLLLVCEDCDQKSLLLLESSEVQLRTDEFNIMKMPECECMEMDVGTNRLPCKDSHLIGGVLDHYSPIFSLHATCNSGFQKQLIEDLIALTHKQFNSQESSDVAAVIANTDSWEIKIVSCERGGTFHSNSSCCSERDIEMSPLVASFVDPLVQLCRYEVKPELLLWLFEDGLRHIYLKSRLLSSYLFEGNTSSCENPFSLAHLTEALGLDVNDLPLLLSVASFHTPSISQMFRLSFK